MSETQVLEIFIEPERAGTYFLVPFDMPPDCETMTLRYTYDRHPENDHPVGNGRFVSRQEANIIDLGLIAPDGTQVGASGSDKTEFTVSATSATPGYHAVPLMPGTWQVLVGAYKVAPEGVRVTYELFFSSKELRLLKGDLHTHTIASDGVLTVEELGWHAVRHGLNFVAVTDHNQFVRSDALPHIPGFIFIPGVEWTHYQGHANFLGVDQPYDGCFAANTAEEVRARFESARSRGALITVNHPCDGGCGFLFDLDSLPFDCLEIWNGPMRETNLRAVGQWQSLLASGKKIPATGGSDYHRDSPFQILGGPTTCVYAMSSSPDDILAAVRSGRSYLIFAPNGPELVLRAGDAMMGDTTSPSQAMQITAGNLKEGDVLRVVTGNGSETLLEAPADGRCELEYRVRAAGFARVEILRAFLPGLPLLPALLSNPIFFE